MKRPDILLIPGAEQHWNTLGFVNPVVKTPNLDRFARQGTHCTRAYAVRDHVICETRHRPTRMRAKTYVDQRYKLTGHRDQSYGELFDLQQDPREVKNLWDCPKAARLKSDLLLRFLHADMAKNPLPMPRVTGA